MLKNLRIAINPILRAASQNIPRNWVVSRCAVSPQSHYCFIRIPKCANSTITRTLAYHDPNLSYDLPSDPDGEIAKGLFSDFLAMHAYSRSALKKKYFLFTFVRNPYTRLLSAYLDKIQESKPAFTSERRQVMHFTEDGQPVSFSGFITYLENGGLYSNPHWCPQSDLLLLKPSELSFIGKTETLDQDLPQVIQSLFGAGSYQSIQTRSTRRRGASDALSEFYDARLMDRVYRLYQCDFESFGYDRSL
jgi:hypothetical protein